MKPYGSDPGKNQWNADDTALEPVVKGRVVEKRAAEAEIKAQVEETTCLYSGYVDPALCDCPAHAPEVPKPVCPRCKTSACLEDDFIPGYDDYFSPPMPLTFDPDGEFVEEE